MHQDYCLHSSVGIAELLSALWSKVWHRPSTAVKSGRKGVNVLNVQSRLLRKAVLKLCLSLPGPVLNKVFLFGGTITTFSFCS